MALQLPPAVSISRFQGGYKSISSYTDLADTETNFSENVVYDPNGDIQKRTGSVRLYKYPLFSSTDTATARVVTGHYYFDKLGTSGSFHVVAAGDSLYNYTSATATPIRTGLNDSSGTFWNFIQIQDPRSAADDIVLGTNGVNPIQVWTGSGTAIALSSFTSASQVPICGALLNHKERVYAINITDATDADAPVKVMRTGFGSDGNADPHRFTETFYIGGSAKDGEILNAKVLNEQLIFYKRGSIWKFSPTSGDIADIYQVQDRVGMLAKYSLVDVGDFHVFLSDQGVFGFDGNNLVHLSEKVDNELFQDANLSQLGNAKAVFNPQKNQYILYFPAAGSSRNNRALVYDLRPTMRIWQPPITGRRVSYISSYIDSNGQRRIIYGDYSGFLYSDDTGNNDGLGSGYNGTATASSANTLTDAAQTFDTSAGGLAGQIIRIIAGTGEGQEEVIGSNTLTVITLESGRNWTITPDTTSQYTIGGINSFWKSKEYDYGGHDITKLFRNIYVRTKEEGNINLTVHYIVDFKELQQATSKNILLYTDGMVWDVSMWDNVRWGGKKSIRKRISLRNTPAQRLVGNYLAIRFYNGRANETFRVNGYDVELTVVGKRLQYGNYT